MEQRTYFPLGYEPRDFARMPIGTATVKAPVLDGAIQLRAGISLRSVERCQLTIATDSRQSSVISRTDGEPLQLVGYDYRGADSLEATSRYVFTEPIDTLLVMRTADTLSDADDNEWCVAGDGLEIASARHLRSFITLIGGFAYRSATT